MEMIAIAYHRGDLMKPALRSGSSCADVFDAFRLALKHYQFANREEEDATIVVKKR
jgi:hypothetical protein